LIAEAAVDRRGEGRDAAGDLVARARCGARSGTRLRDATRGRLLGARRGLATLPVLDARAHRLRGRRGRYNHDACRLGESAVHAGNVGLLWAGEQVYQQGLPLPQDGIGITSLAEGPENDGEECPLLRVYPRFCSDAAVAAAAHRIEEAVGEVPLDRAGKSRVVQGLAPAVANRAPVIQVGGDEWRTQFVKEVGPVGNSGDALGKLSGAGQDTVRAVGVPLALPV